MTTIYHCENCNHESAELAEIDIVDWANEQDPADVVGIPSGCCTMCYAPVYEPGTFDKIDAARAMLAALEACEGALASIADGGNPQPSRDTFKALTDFAVAAIAQAKAAGITPA